ncbi:MAG: TatD family hydrolase [Deltaproteobacteria bacterium]|nr:TatD family hydrolase [Deltaproteobacteria bacterium]
MLDLFDTHTHLDAPEFDHDREAVIARARAAGVRYFLTVGVGGGLDSARRILPIIATHDFIWGSVGVHPHNAAIPLDIEALNELASHPKIVAIGETGLDFFHDHCPHERQELWFRAQIELALRLKKPLIIHSRNAGPTCLRILKEMHADQIGGVFHCFSEDQSFAAELFEINFRLSVPGTVTFKKAETLREVIRSAPLHQILLETDAPYLAPVPYRGKRCESAYMVETAKMVADLKGLPLEELAAQTSANAFTLFGINPIRGENILDECRRMS